MMLVHYGQAPYAPASAIISVLEKHRQVRLAKIDDQTLEFRIGITETLRPRVLRSLKVLGFIDEEDVPTEEFAKLPGLSDADYMPYLAEMLKIAYAPILEDVGSANLGDADAVEAAFRGFTPTGQIKRMVNLYLGLMSYAGIIPETPRRRSTVKSVSAAAMPGTPLRPRAITSRPVVIDKPIAVTAGSAQLSHAVTATTVELKSGGTVTLGYNVSLFDLNDYDQKFVLDLVRMVKNYGDSHPSKGSSVATEGGD